jgi:hypothetical protein
MPKVGRLLLNPFVDILFTPPFQWNHLCQLNN